MFLVVLAMTVFAFAPGEDEEEQNVEVPDLIIASPQDGKGVRFSNPDEAIEFMQKSGNWADYESGILPKMVEEELPYAERLLNNDHDGFIVVDKGRMKVIKYNKYGDEIATYGMCCAKNYGNKHQHNDCRTPEGFFTVRGVQNSEGWHYIDENGNVSKRDGEFGPRFIRLNTPVTKSIGIHGTCAPWSIGGRRSHGCIRIKNENIMKLVEMVDSGMPVIITPGKKDMAVNAREGTPVPHISTL